MAGNAGVRSVPIASPFIVSSLGTVLSVICQGKRNRCPLAIYPWPASCRKCTMRKGERKSSIGSASRKLAKRGESDEAPVGGLRVGLCRDYDCMPPDELGDQRDFRRAARSRWLGSHR